MWLKVFLGVYEVKNRVIIKKSANGRGRWLNLLKKMVEVAGVEPSVVLILLAFVSGWGKKGNMSVRHPAFRLKFFQTSISINQLNLVNLKKKFNPQILITRLFHLTLHCMFALFMQNLKRSIGDLLVS